MKFLGRTWASGRFGVITITILALVILFTPTVFTGSAGATGPRPKRPHSKTQLRKGPPMLPFGKSKPLHPVINPPKPVTILPHSAIKAALSAGCTAINVDLKVLLIDRWHRGGFTGNYAGIRLSGDTLHALPCSKNPQRADPG